MEIKIIDIENPDSLNFILGHSHFIKTVEDLHEALISAMPQIKFGLAFCEASQKCLVRFSGNDDSLIDLAKRNAINLSAGHTFIIFLRNAFPINVLNSIKNVQEVCTIHCATSNPVQVVVMETELGRGILGVIDGYRSKGFEDEEERRHRKEFLRTIGYKL